MISPHVVQESTIRSLLLFVLPTIIAKQTPQKKKRKKGNVNEYPKADNHKPLHIPPPVSIPAKSNIRTRFLSLFIHCHVPWRKLYPLLVSGASNEIEPPWSCFLIATLSCWSVKERASIPASFNSLPIFSAIINTALQPLYVSISPWRGNWNRALSHSM
ncbi:hypothetical protein F4813DRAFT_46062 [Daldinia decipiens]|uniref:uncharacterized protein n=1 Tax=Daldinia decipiens TaxID=326647 RepID=UPI0020C53279|nr:uncharacterized protein F4813DRAFT_46062 [Daldinia decipiens]KAI1658318.1 hypothetical protein F4813DRAFT_46062 [Daldinia decipiens]